jgi:pyrimidine-nucleoside phosphorylase
LIGQTAEIAPADKKLYALRDVTATVPCRPLMAASILSKKLAEGISGLVLDVKAGSGAFMKTAGEARALAELLAGIVSAMNKKCVGLITDMSQPLGNAVGNSVEVIEAFDTLRGEGPEDFTALCRELSAHMLVLGGAAGDLDTGRRIYDRLIESGDALEKMREIIAEQQGDVRVLDDSARLPRARSTSDVISRSAGFVASINTETIGWAAMSLGAGRVRLDSEIDHSVGLILRKKVGDRVSHSESLATIHYNESGREAEAARAVESAYEIESDRRSPPPLIYEVID